VYIYIYLYVYMYIHIYYVNVSICSNIYVAAMAEAVEVHPAALVEAGQSVF